MVAKRRSRMCSRSGEENPNVVRLTNDQVREIRSRWQSAEKWRGLQTALANEFDVSQTNISLIVRSKSRL
jgi:hypothetical protein